MTYKMTVRGAPPALIKRVYRCTDCGHQFEWTHFSRDEPVPECSNCAALAAQPMPSAPAIRTANLHKAVGMAQSMMEDLGHTDMADNLRPGDIAAKGPRPVQTAEREEIVREMKEFAGENAALQLNAGMQNMVDKFWSGGAAFGGGTMLPSGDMAQLRGTGHIAGTQGGPDVTNIMQAAPTLKPQVEAAVSAKE